MSDKKPLRNRAQLERIYTLVGTTLDYTLRKLKDEQAPISAALAQAAVAYLALHQWGTELALDPTATTPTATTTTSTKGEYDNTQSELDAIEETRRRLGIKPVQWTTEEKRAMEG